MNRFTAIIGACILLFGKPAFAHRIDEYLQATILSLEQNHVRASRLMIGGLFSADLAAFSYRYVAKVALVPPNIAANCFFNPWIIVQAAAASTALLLGGAYVTGCLVGGVWGLILSPGGSTGLVAAVGFGTLAALWLYVTVQGLPQRHPSRVLPTPWSTAPAHSSIR